MMVLLGVLPLAFIQQAIYSMTDGQGGAEAIEPHRVSAVQSGLVGGAGCDLYRRQQLRCHRAQTPRLIWRFQNTAGGDDPEGGSKPERPIQATLFFRRQMRFANRFSRTLMSLAKLSPNFRFRS